MCRGQKSAPGVCPVSLTLSTGHSSKWILWITLGSSCLHNKFFMEWAISPTPKSYSKILKQKHNKQYFYWRVIIFTSKLQTSKAVCVLSQKKLSTELCTLKFEACGSFQVESLSVTRYSWCALSSLILTRANHRKGNWGWWLELCQGVRTWFRPRQCTATVQC